MFGFKRRAARKALAALATDSRTVIDAAFHLAAERTDLTPSERGEEQAFIIVNVVTKGTVQLSHRVLKAMLADAQDSAVSALPNIPDDEEGIQLKQMLVWDAMMLHYYTYACKRMNLYPELG